MRVSKQDIKPQADINVHEYSLSADEEERIRADLEGMTPQVEHFPVADYHVLIEGNSRDDDTSVKLTLVLPGTTLTASDHDVVMHAAFERCLAILRDRLQDYKERLGGVAEREKLQQGTHHELHPTVAIDAEQLATAVRARDYTAFHAALLPYEEELRKAVGRWVQRYPDVEDQIDDRLKIADIVEEVCLLAFDGYSKRPANVTLGDWLSELIDSAIKALIKNPAEELENIELVRSAREPT